MATKKAGGSTRNGRDSAGKRLGVKHYGGETVRGGSILIRQRGNTFHAGQHVGTGKDYTLFAKRAGQVLFTVQKTAKSKKTLVHIIPANG